jgi:hypothetical protein
MSTACYGYCISCKPTRKITFLSRWASSFIVGGCTQLRAASDPPDKIHFVLIAFGSTVSTRCIAGGVLQPFHWLGPLVCPFFFFFALMCVIFRMLLPPLVVDAFCATLYPVQISMKSETPFPACRDAADVLVPLVANARSVHCIFNPCPSLWGHIVVCSVFPEPHHCD